MLLVLSVHEHEYDHWYEPELLNITLSHPFSGNIKYR